MIRFGKHIVEFENGQFAIRKKIFFISYYLDIDDYPSGKKWRTIHDKWFKCCLKDEGTIRHTLTKLQKKKNKHLKIKKIHD